MIEVQKVSKQYILSKQQKKELQTNNASFFAVKNVTLTCTPGKVFSLLGATGAGKTTTLRMIATILKPTQGNILVGGESVTDNPEKVRSKIGFLTGSTNLYDKLTPGEIVKYFADLHGLKKETFEQRRDMLFTKLNIHEFSKKRIAQISTGMKQKVSIARSMIHDPQIVIFDEPTSGLDVITAHNIIELIQQCKAEGKTIIFSSHIMSEVELLCDDLAIISKGNLIYNDSMHNFKDAYQNQSLTEAFITIVKSSTPKLTVAH